MREGAYELDALRVVLRSARVLDRHGLEELLVERQAAHHVVEEPADPFDLAVGQVVAHARLAPAPARVR